MDEPEPLVSAARRRMARPELNQLEVFLKVVETGSFSAAARQLGKTQPAISQTIARLEEIYGHLFERRNGVPLGLTPIGKAILPSVRTLLHTVDELMQRAVATAVGQSGTLAIGLDACLGLGPLSVGIRDLLAEGPEIRLHIVEAAARELHRQLNESAIDIMFVMAEPRPVDAGLVRELLWQDRLMLVMREDHPLAAQPSVRSCDLSSLSLILRRAWLSAQAILGRDQDYDVCDISTDTLFDLVAIGMGQTIAPESAFIPRPGLVALPVDDGKAIVPIEGVWPQEMCNPLRDRLLNSIRGHHS